ncbi:MAG: enoyl-CoA hydratase/isomerase family protein [Planctomycetota bacterium]|nr:enoyl-CoA hydratase/isomerase family protein [Planctomycetota bacterium]
MSGLATLSIDGRIARLTLNRPEKRNALSLELLEAVHACVDQLAGRTDVSVCVLAGAGGTFCSGMDLKAVLDSPGAPLRLLSSIAELTLKLHWLPQVAVARVRGAAIGGGCGLACVCDIAVTHPDAKLGFPEVDLGVCPAVVAPWLVRSVGAGRARRILLQGGTMSGLQAHTVGMVAHCVPSEELDGFVDELAGRLALAGPQALRVTKKLLGEIDGERLTKLVRDGAALSAQVLEGPEARSMLSKKLGERGS